ncbi:MAG: hypothetical protein U5N56_09585 [Candidatus Marinimicrobia bacterium]|nr:hypothetical protein [Candidatus Neomarinimicrobiota bacterium]
MKKPYRYLIVLILLSGILFADSNREYRSKWTLSWEEFYKKEEKKIGLALGGGAVSGAVHIGVTKGNG